LPAKSFLIQDLGKEPSLPSVATMGVALEGSSAVPGDPWPPIRVASVRIRRDTRRCSRLARFRLDWYSLPHWTNPRTRRQALRMDAPSVALLRPARPRWLLLGLALFFAVLSVQYALKVRDDRRSAFVRWRPQILDLDAGINIYERHNHPNPPLMPLLLLPLAWLPPPAGALLWFFLKAGLAVLALDWTFRLLESSDRPFPAWARLLAVVLAMKPLMGDLTHGNVNIFILFLIVAALRALCRRRPARAGLLLSLAIACKLTPALFLPYLIWKRAWRALAGCALGLVLFVWLLPSCFLGVRANAELLMSWAQHMVVPYLEGAVTSEHQNQSLPGVLYRLTTHAASFSEYQGGGYVPTAYHNLLTLPPELVHGLLVLCMMAFTLLLARTCRPPLAPRPPWRLAAEFALVLLGMLLFSERTWKHHYVTLIVPVAVLLYAASTRHMDRRVRGWTIGSLLAAFVLMTLTGTGVPGVPEHLGKLAEVYGAFLWANLLLVGALLLVLRCPSSEQTGETYSILEARLRESAQEPMRDRGAGVLSSPTRLPT
jgi:alpha-1,2-mannosyltransferase